ncbi:hypothetical protein QVD17_33286 [Tagetes erecta]|uniref:Uncharacterized protein n=1 Tax=Tagetes erecta TaxID=13708 RepID=A0AAD8JZB0_TARER|nr:hypothetical protein QVD17_33286 [Tagetes erecta]
MKNLSISQHHKSSLNYKSSTNGSIDIHHQTTTGWFEIRLFYVRITPCAINNVPSHLTLRNLRREIGVSLEMNGIRVPSANPVLVTLRKDRVDKESSEVVYVSTDNIRVSGAVEFEVIDDDDDDKMMILCGSVERIEEKWSNNNGLKMGWSMDCYGGDLVKFGNGFLSIEVYVAGCCAMVPVILTKTVRVSARRRGSKCGTLDAIPEDEEEEEEEENDKEPVNRKLAFEHAGEERYDYESEAKVRPYYCSEEMYYYDEDGQLTWFNAGVRVGVGIGLGMCLGIGIGVVLIEQASEPRVVVPVILTSVYTKENENGRGSSVRICIGYRVLKRVLADSLLHVIKSPSSSELKDDGCVDVEMVCHFYAFMFIYLDVQHSCFERWYQYVTTANLKSPRFLDYASTLNNHRTNDFLATV